MNAQGSQKTGKIRSGSGRFVRDELLLEDEKDFEKIGKNDDDGDLISESSRSGSEMSVNVKNGKLGEDSEGRLLLSDLSPSLEGLAIPRSELCQKIERMECLNCLNVCNLDDNVFVLAMLFTANSTFTLAQFLGAVAANSLSMYGDCATMALDSFTYLLNIYAENSKISGTPDALKLEIFVSTISIATLTSVTSFLLWDAIQRLKTTHPDDEIVEANIMLRFSLVNLVIDIFACLVFVSKLHPDNKFQRIKKSSKLKIEISEHLDYDIEYAEEEDSTSTLQKLKPRNMNMASAFLHLSADTIRTVTVLFTAIIVDVDKKDVDSVDADAIGSIVVSVIILAVAVALCFELAQLAVGKDQFQCQSNLIS